MRFTTIETRTTYGLIVSAREFELILDRDDELLAAGNYEALLSSLIGNVPNLYGSLRYHKNDGPYIRFTLKHDQQARSTGLDTNAISLEQIHSIVRAYINEQEDMMNIGFNLFKGIEES